MNNPVFANKAIEHLWLLAGEVGTLAEDGDACYEDIYVLLCDALNLAEDNKLIKYE